MINRPVCIYINWSAYDELSDNVELTEAIAMKQFDELLRLRKLGVRLDYYLMDCFWYSPAAPYRQWRKPHWPRGPQRWLDACRKHGVLPGLWVASNRVSKFEPPQAWQASHDARRGTYCCFRGPFMQAFVDAMAHWYDQGVRLFKFDFARFDAAPPDVEASLLPSQIREANILAFEAALRSFRRTRPDVMLIAYNGFDEIKIQNSTDQPLFKAIDTRWLETFDALYCGDPRAADVPAHNFWRAKDVYSDHMVRFYQFNGFPLQRIDNAGFMIGTTGTCYYRRKAAWKGMLLLSLARGGWANTYYGNLDLLDTNDAKWFARAQQLYLPLQASLATTTFGGIPGRAEPYGYAALPSDGSGVITVVNPSQATATLALPVKGKQRLLFRDGGFEPRLSRGSVTLGPEQMAVIGIGDCATDVYDLGVHDDVVIPQRIAELPATFEPDGDKAIVATITPKKAAALRIVMQQFDDAGRVIRSTGGQPPTGSPMHQYLSITATQAGHDLPVTVNYDKVIWSGLSWAVGEIAADALVPGKPVHVRAATIEPRKVHLRGHAYAVSYNHTRGLP